ITDSDVFSIIVDPRQPKTVYLSACSGIYKSVDAGLQFTGGVGVNKSQGIPSTARRTRVLLQDPENPDTVFAGTTEGLYRTFDGGKYWVQTTSDDVIVNDVYIDPMNPKHVLLATERRGVLASSDGGDSFAPSNTGFSAQQITAFTPDAGHAATVYIGVVNDKDAGGVFVSHAGGLRWSHLSDGLDGHDVLSLGQAVDGSILAGTESGIYRLTGTTWTRVGEGDASSGAPARRVEVRSELRRRAAAKTHAADVDGSVYGFALTGDTLFAASSQGLLRSASSGMTWTVVNSIPLGEWRFVAAAKSTVAVASLSEGQASRLELSSDGGNTWQPVSLPGKVGQISALAVDPQGEIWIGGRDGVYISPDKGASWGMLTDVIVRGVNNLYYDPRADRMLMTAADPSTVAFSIDVRTKQAASWDTGWNLRFLRPIGNYLVGATLFDGIVVQPRMVDSADVAKPAAIAAPADAVRQADAARH
ncbi:MAG TPA: hypothetical protein VMU37_08740, partial [Caulobacteraceae bacterium]|nr:hypothetical protein [Caulobacteraceae bacterium]